MMSHTKIYINPIEFQKAMARKGLFKWIDGKDILIPPYDIEPIEGYVERENYPQCCEFHKLAFADAKAYFDKFPYCCEAHKRLANLKEINNPEFKNLAEKILTKLSFTEFLIEKRLQSSDWFEDITEYIEYCIDSFGHPHVGGGHYLHYVHHWINNTVEISSNTEKVQKLNTYFDRYKDSVPKAEPIDINQLHGVYSKWLNTFPFDLTLFSGLKAKLNKSFPLLAETPVYNRYLKTAKAKMITQNELIEYLFGLTKNILQSVDTIELVNKGLITDHQKHRLELINSNHKIRQESILGQFSKAEAKYLKTIKRWLSNELIYAKELKEYVSDIPKSQNARNDIDNLSLDAISKQENKFRKGLPMNVVVNHFKVFIERKSKNGKPFLTEAQLISFLQKAFLNRTELPKQKINLAIGEKGFVIKRFYELFELAVSQYHDLNKKFDYIGLIETCFDNWDAKTIEPLFKPNKTNENW